MKIKAIVLLGLFIYFIVAPTVLSTLCKNVDISIAFSFLAEEEETHKVEVISDVFVEKQDTSLFKNQKKSDKIIANFLLKSDNGYVEVISPPPENKLV